MDLRVTEKGRQVADGLKRQFRRAQRQLVRLDQPKIMQALASLGKPEADTLFVHSSLSACGFVRGGASTVIGALKAWASDSTSLAMPTHTWSYPEKGGVAPVYDRTKTPSVVGAITNHFWRQPGVVRSFHSSHSLAYRGPQDEEFCLGHELCETPCGQGTPYEKMALGKSSVLMFGATLDSYTLFHTAEDAAQVPYLYMPEKVTLFSKDTDGTIKEILSRRQDMGVKRRFAAMTPVLHDRGLLRRCRLGRGELLFIPSAAALHEWLVTELRQDPLLLVAESDRFKIAKAQSAA